MNISTNNSIIKKVKWHQHKYTKKWILKEFNMKDFRIH